MDRGWLELVVEEVVHVALVAGSGRDASDPGEGAVARGCLVDGVVAVLAPQSLLVLPLLLLLLATHRQEDACNTSRGVTTAPCRHRVC